MVFKRVFACDCTQQVETDQKHGVGIRFQYRSAEGEVINHALAGRVGKRGRGANRASIALIFLTCYAATKPTLAWVTKRSANLQTRTDARGITHTYSSMP